MESRRNRQKQNSELSLRDLAFICIGHWRWFLVSLFLCLLLAVLYLLKTPTSYTSYASILIKEDEQGKSIGTNMAKAFSDMGLSSSNTNVYNELLTLKSKDLARNVVKRLALNVNYSVAGTFHDVTIYGEDLPINVDFPAVEDKNSISFDIDLESNGKVTLSNFVYNGEDVPGQTVGTAGYNILRTPVGRIVVRSTHYYNTHNTKKTIHVNRTSVDKATNKLMSIFKADLDNKDATVINMSYVDVSPKRAEDVLATIISVYNENWVKDKNQIAVSTSEFISERLQVIEKELGNVDNDISSYKSAHEITDIKTASEMYMRQSQSTETEILGLNNQLYMAKYIRNYLANAANNRQLLPANSGINNQTINTQIADYNSTMLRRNNITSDKNPVALDLEAQLASMRTAIISTIDNEIKTLQTQINSQRGLGGEALSKITSNPQQAKYLLSVERQQKVKESLYLFLLQKREENELSQAFTAYNTRIVNDPLDTAHPTAPQSKKILLFALFMGFCIPLIITYIHEIMNTTVRGKKDVDDKITMPYIGEIPLFEDNIDPKKYEFWKKKKQHKDIVVRAGSRGVVNEAFRVIGTNLEFLAKKDSGIGNVFMTTSYNPASGKSFIAINLGAILTLKKKHVLVIDGDLRHASVSSFIKSPQKGLADYLINNIGNIEDVIDHGTAFEGLDVLPVGTIPPNPSELLSTKKFADAIKYLRTKYDYILIDCPPANMMADATIIEELVDRTIFIIRAGLFERSLLPQLEQDFKEGKFKNMCFMLNGTYGLKSHYNSRYGYGYGYKYGGYGQKADFSD